MHEKSPRSFIAVQFLLLFPAGVYGRKKGLEEVNALDQKYRVIIDSLVHPRKPEWKDAEIQKMLDRILVERGQKQVYGTQVQMRNEKGEFLLFPIENEAGVDSRRRKAGLTTLKAFKATLN